MVFRATVRLQTHVLGEKDDAHAPRAQYLQHAVVGQAGRSRSGPCGGARSDVSLHHVGRRLGRQREQPLRQLGGRLPPAEGIGRRASEAAEERVCTQKGLHFGGAGGTPGKVLAEATRHRTAATRRGSDADSRPVGARIDGCHGKLRFGPSESPGRSTTEPPNPYATFSDLVQQAAQMLAQASQNAALGGVDRPDGHRQFRRPPPPPDGRSSRARGTPSRSPAGTRRAAASAHADSSCRRYSCSSKRLSSGCGGRRPGRRRRGGSGARASRLT